MKCLYNTGAILMAYQKRPLGTSNITEYGELGIGREYLVMGMILNKGVLSYLIDDGGVISACPYQLFEVISNILPFNWHFKALTISDNKYINYEALWGYHELCFLDDHYEKLLDMDDEAYRIYLEEK